MTEKVYSPDLEPSQESLEALKQLTLLGDLMKNLDVETLRKGGAETIFSFFEKIYQSIEDFEEKIGVNLLQREAGMLGNLSEKERELIKVVITKTREKILPLIEEAVKQKKAPGITNRNKTTFIADAEAKLMALEIYLAGLDTI
jgi:hypothetical protein